MSRFFLFQEEASFLCQTHEEGYVQQRMGAENKSHRRWARVQLGVSLSHPKQAELNPSRHAGPGEWPRALEIHAVHRKTEATDRLSHLPSTTPTNLAAAVPSLPLALRTLVQGHPLLVLLGAPLTPLFLFLLHLHRPHFCVHPRNSQKCSGLSIFLKRKTPYTPRCPSRTGPVSHLFTLGL